MTKVFRIVLLLVLAVVVVPFALYLFIASKIRRKPRPAKTVTEQDVAKAEKRLGFRLPDEVRAYFLEEKTRTARRCICLYRPSAAVEEFRMLTKRPYGPEGQDWPRSYFPVADLLPGYALYDLESGTIVEWDPEDLGEEDDRPDLWDLSFTRTGMSLRQWLETPEPKPSQ